MQYIHKLADVKSINIGSGTRVWQFSVILEKAVLGSNCNICAHTFIENDVVIGNNVTIKCGVFVWDGITIEDNVQVGPNVTFTNDKYPRAKQSFDLRRTIIRENVSIGAGATIICGIEIGTNAMIGAGAVVTKNVPPFSLWIGNPARHAGFVTRNGTVLNFEMKDRNGNQYKIVNDEPLL